jgi:hypothetical protein
LEESGLLGVFLRKIRRMIVCHLVEVCFSWSIDAIEESDEWMACDLLIADDSEPPLHCIICESDDLFTDSRLHVFVFCVNPDAFVEIL